MRTPRSGLTKHIQAMIIAARIVRAAQTTAQTFRFLDVAERLEFQDARSNSIIQNLVRTHSWWVCDASVFHDAKQQMLVSGPTNSIWCLRVLLSVPCIIASKTIGGGISGIVTFVFLFFVASSCATRPGCWCESHFWQKNTLGTTDFIGAAKIANPFVIQSHPSVYDRRYFVAISSLHASP